MSGLIEQCLTSFPQNNLRSYGPCFKKYNNTMDTYAALGIVFAKKKTRFVSSLFLRHRESDHNYVP